MRKKQFRNRNYNNKFSQKKRERGDYILLFSVLMIIVVAVYLYFDLKIYDKPESVIGGDNFGPNYESTNNEIEYNNQEEKTNLKNLNKQNEIIEIKKFTLDLINKQRAKAGINEVIQGDNPTAQILANHSFETRYYGDLLRNGKTSDMVYSENKGNSYLNVYSRMSGFYNTKEDGTTDWLPDENCRRLQTIATCTPVQPKKLINSIITDEELKDFILDPVHKKFNLGIAYDHYLLYLYFSFEGGDFIVEEIKIKDGFLELLISNHSVDYIISDNSIQLFFYQPPKEIFTEVDYIIQQNYYDSIYNVEYARILKPPPPNTRYIGLDENDFIATQWSILGSQLKISAFLGDKLNPEGFYSIRVWGTNIRTSVDNLLIDYGVFR